MINSHQLLSRASVLWIILLSSFVTVTRSDHNDPLVNYMSTTHLGDGEKEVRMRFGDIIVRETSVTAPKPNDPETRLSFVLRQVSSGADFIQMIYQTKEKDGNTGKQKLMECEIVNDWGAANQFRSQFESELRKSGLTLKVPSYHKIFFNKSMDENESIYLNSDIDSKESGDAIDLEQGVEDYKNVTVQILKNEDFAGKLLSSFDIIKQQKLCRRLHRKQKKSLGSFPVQKPKSSRVKRGIENRELGWGTIPGTYWCGVGTLAETFSTLGPYVGADRCCRIHDTCPYIIKGFSTKYGYLNYAIHTLSHCSCDESLSHEKSSNTVTSISWGKSRRKKRGITEAFRYPGTMWCGMHDSAPNYRHLGGYTGADKCCRLHDIACPYFIEGMREKYGYFNWRIMTMNHCTCDERFRSCLKMTNTGAANIVGKVFFNVLQTKCFVLKPEKVCTKSSWWGKCLKYEVKKQAHVRDPVPYMNTNS